MFYKNMEQIKSDILEQVLSLTNYYDYNIYTGNDVQKTLNKEILDIEALMMLGRGDSDTFEKSLAYLVETYPNDDVESKGLAIDYIISKSPLDRYLSDGLDILNGTYERDSN